MQEVRCFRSARGGLLSRHRRPDKDREGVTLLEGRAEVVARTHEASAASRSRKRAV